MCAKPVHMTQLTLTWRANED